MSISNLFVDNNYSLRCKSLACNELNAANFVLPNDVNIVNDLNVGGDITVVGDIDARSGLGVAGNTVMTGTLDAQNDVAVGGDITIIGNTRAQNNLIVGGDTTIAGTTGAQGNLTVGGNTIMTGGVFAQNNLSVFGNIAIGGDAVVTGDITMSGNAAITGNTTMTGTLTAPSILFAVGQNQLNNYYFVDGVLNGEAGFAGEVANLPYAATRIGRIVTLMIAGFAPVLTTTTGIPTLGDLPAVFVPPANFGQDGLISVNSNGVRVPIIVKNDGKIEFGPSRASGTTIQIASATSNVILTYLI